MLKYSCLHFHPTMPLHPSYPPLPSSNLLPLALSMCRLYMFLDGPSPIIPYCLSSPLLSGYCQFVLFFIYNL